MATSDLELSYGALLLLERQASLAQSLLRAALRQGAAWHRCPRYSEPWVRALTSYARTQREADAAVAELRHMVEVLAPLVSAHDTDPAAWWPPQSLPPDE